MSTGPRFCPKNLNAVYKRTDLNQDQPNIDLIKHKRQDFSSVHHLPYKLFLFQVHVTAFSPNPQVKSERETIRIDADLASSLTPAELRPGMAVATVTGDLRAKDNK